MNPKSDGPSATIATALPFLVVDRVPSAVASRVGLSKSRQLKVIVEVALAALFASAVWTAVGADAEMEQMPMLR